MKKDCKMGFTLIEVLVAMTIFVVGLAGVFLVYGQTLRMVSSTRQISRAEEVALANIEFLRTRSWDQLTNVYVTTASTTPSQNSSNLTESTGKVVMSSSTNSPVCTHLVLLSSDPLKIGLNTAVRDLQFSPNPATTVITTQTMLTATVLVSWETWRGTRLTNSLTTYLTKGGMTADVTQ